MTLAQLEYFSAVCHNNFNISKTAEHLNVSQPAISNAIKDLENEFNVKLFNRINKRLELTREGEICLSSVDIILNSTAKLAEEMYDITHKKETLNIGISSMIGSKYIPKILSLFHQKYPKINFEIITSGSLSLMELIESEELDFAFCNIHKTVNYQLHKLSVIPLYKSNFLFCTSTDNPLSKKSFVTYEMLENEPLVVKKENNIKDSIIKKKFLNKGLTPNIQMYIEQTDTIKNFIRSGMVSSFLFEDMIGDEKNLVGIPFEESEYAVIGIVHKSNHFFSQHEAELVKMSKTFCIQNLGLL